MARRVLVCWIGSADLSAPSESAKTGFGPIAQALKARSFDAAYLLCDWPEDKAQSYVDWLKGQTATKLRVVSEKLSGPTQFGEIYEAAVRVCEKALGREADDTKLTFHLSPGTSQMAAVWVILAKTRFAAELIESSQKHGVQTASVPFDMSAEFLPDLLRRSDQRLQEFSAGVPPRAPEFDSIVRRCALMERVITRARQVAVRGVPVLIEGESGTGKELLARAIHRASPRREMPFKALNCGAIPPTLVESELFGHERGAFTDAKGARPGYFESAKGGTLFLDEVGELPLPAQVKLLRVLQEAEITRVGSTTPIKVDVRIIAATNRSLGEEVGASRFREDLFFRLAVAVLKLPPLRERRGDLGPLIESLLQQVNNESESEPGFQAKKLSSAAKNVLLNHDWPGNVRELQNTLRRAAIWSQETTIGPEDIREAILPAPGGRKARILDRPLGNGFDLRALLAQVARHYLSRALEESHGVKKEAAKLVGLPSYQTFTNWLEKYEVEDGTEPA